MTASSSIQIAPPRHGKKLLLATATNCVSKLATRNLAETCPCYSNKAMLPTFQNRLFTLSCDVKRCLLDVLWSWVEVGGHGSDIASSENLLASKEALFQAPLAYIFPLRSWVEVFLSIQVSRGDEESDSSFALCHIFDLVVASEQMGQWHVL